MLTFWELNVLIGVLFAVRIGKDYFQSRNRFTFFMLLGFIVFCLGSSISGLLLHIEATANIVVVEWIWRGMLLLMFSVLTPVYVKYVSEFPGASLELAAIALLIAVGEGSQFTLPFINLLCIGAIYFGCYEWLRLRHNVT